MTTWNVYVRAIRKTIDSVRCILVSWPNKLHERFSPKPLDFTIAIMSFNLSRSTCHSKRKKLKLTLDLPVAFENRQFPANFPCSRTWNTGSCRHEKRRCADNTVRKSRYAWYPAGVSGPGATYLEYSCIEQDDNKMKVRVIYVSTRGVALFNYRAQN